MIGGDLTCPGCIPWQVAIYTGTWGTPLSCGGSILSSKYVLTAAHCLYTWHDEEEFEDYTCDQTSITTYHYPIQINETSIYAGSRRLESLDFLDDQEATKHRIRRVFQHEKYNPTLPYPRDLDYDFAILELTDEINLVGPTAKARAVCLPGEKVTDNFKNGTKFVASGWGTTSLGGLSEYLKNAKLPYVPPEECESKWLDFEKEHPAEGDGKFLHESMICAGYIYDGPNAYYYDACQGDSGGNMLRFLQAINNQ